MSTRSSDSRENYDAFLARKSSCRHRDRRGVFGAQSRAGQIVFYAPGGVAQRDRARATVS